MTRYTDSPTLSVAPVDGPDRDAPLYHRYPQQSQPQPAYVRLDLRDGSLDAWTTGEVGPPYAVPESHWHGDVLTWPVPSDISAAALRALLAEIAPLAARVLAGAEWEFSARQHPTVAVLSDDAETEEKA